MAESDGSSSHSALQGVCCVDYNHYGCKGVCCVDYNHYGCTSDADCCYENSYCHMETGLCRREMWQRSESGTYQDNAQSEVINVDHLSELKQLKHADMSRIKLSASLKIILFLAVFLVSGNVMCCVHDRLRASKATLIYPAQDDHSNRNVDII